MIAVDWSFIASVLAVWVLGGFVVAIIVGKLIALRDAPTASDTLTLRRLRHVDAVYDELSDWENEVLDAAHEARDEGSNRAALVLNTLSHDISKTRQVLTVLRDRIEAS